MHVYVASTLNLPCRPRGPSNSAGMLIATLGPSSGRGATRSADSAGACCVRGLLLPIWILTATMASPSMQFLGRRGCRSGSPSPRPAVEPTTRRLSQTTTPVPDSSPADPINEGCTVWHAPCSLLLRLQCHPDDPTRHRDKRGHAWCVSPSPPLEGEGRVRAPHPVVLHRPLQLTLRGPVRSPCARRELTGGQGAPATVRDPEEASFLASSPRWRPPVSRSRKCSAHPIRTRNIKELP